MRTKIMVVVLCLILVTAFAALALAAGNENDPVESRNQFEFRNEFSRGSGEFCSEDCEQIREQRQVREHINRCLEQNMETRMMKQHRMNRAGQ